MNLFLGTARSCRPCTLSTRAVPLYLRPKPHHSHSWKLNVRVSGFGSFSKTFHQRFSSIKSSSRPSRTSPPPPGGRRLILSSLGASALTPAALVSLSEETSDDDEKTGEQHMLEASREELDAQLPEWIADSRSVWRKMYIFFDDWLIEPVCTALRFFHLVFIFVPVIVTIPVVYFGRRVKERDDERTGTLWWYWFLVSSMERAGAAFIKVYSYIMKFFERNRLTQHYSWDSGQRQERTFSLKRCAAPCRLCTPTHQHIPSRGPNA